MIVISMSNEGDGLKLDRYCIKLKVSNIVHLQKSNSFNLSVPQIHACITQSDDSRRLSDRTSITGVHNPNWNPDNSTSSPTNLGFVSVERGLSSSTNSHVH
jgi:hypothetical protein